VLKIDNENSYYDSSRAAIIVEKAALPNLTLS
jgi:hypothetical protein